MRLTTYLLMTLVCAWALPALGQEAGGQPRPPSAPDSPALDQPPPEPPPPPPPTPRPEPGIPGGPRPPEPDGVAPPPTPRPSAPRIDPLLRLIAERRPELAERLERLRRESPARFREVVLDALTARLEEALNEVESQPERPLGLPGDGQGGRGGGGRAGPPALRERGPAGPPELRAHVRELE